MVRQVVGARALDVLVLEAAHAIQLRLVQPVEQILELRLGFAGVADDEGRSKGDVGAGRAPGRDLVERPGRRGGAGHALQHVGVRVLERNVEIGQHPRARRRRVSHQRHQVADMRIGIDIVQPHPRPERAEVAGEVGDVGAVPAIHLVPAVQPVGRGVLRDHQQLAYAGLHQLFRLAHDRVGRAADEAAAHVGDDAELAAVVAALGNLEIGVVARGQLHRGRGQQVHERIGRGRHGGVDRVQHLFVLVRPGHGQHLGMRAGDVVGFRPQAAGHDHAPVFNQRLADRVEAFGLGAVEKAAGVHDHRIRALIVGADRIALGPQAGQNALAVHQRLGAAKADHADGRLAVAARVGRNGRAREIGTQKRGILGQGLGHGGGYSARRAGRKAPLA